jgi:hypothetical protein
MTMADDMWALIPAVYRRRDAEGGGVLQALIAVLGEQAEVIRDDIAELYDNWFIETCDDWAVPYIGDLTGALPLVQTGDVGTAAEVARLARVASPRMLVANAIRYRRRKGCFSIIAQLAHDVARWPAEAVEFGRLLAQTQDVRDPMRRGFTAALRDPRPLAWLGTPGDRLARSLDVRDADANRSPGRYGPANIGVFVFTPTITSVERGDSYCAEEEDAACFCFDALGHDTPLYRPASTTSRHTRLPGPITRDELREDLTSPHPVLYGSACCIMIWVQSRADGQFDAQQGATIMSADLAHWRERPPAGFVAVDPELGRIAFPERAAPHRVSVAYSYALPAGIGGGGYARPRQPETLFDPKIEVKHYLVTAQDADAEGHDSLRAAVEQWRNDGAQQAIIEFNDNDDLTYDEDRLLIDLSGTPRRLLIRAAPQTRPVIRLTNYEAGAADAWRIRGDGSQGSILVLEGLTVGGRAIELSDYAGSLKIRNCTLIPGWRARGGHERRHHEAPSLAFENCTGPVTVEASILGPVFVRADEHIDEPLPIHFADSILDAGERPCFLSPGTVPYLELSMRRCTVLGSAAVHAIRLAENSIFTGELHAARRGTGCVRFCALPLESRTPRRTMCVPRAGEDPGLRPVFVSRTYGDVGYAMLAPGCPEEIAQGADDRSEMGAYHDLFRPQRDANLRAALAEYLPASSSVGIIYVR